MTNTTALVTADPVALAAKVQRRLADIPDNTARAYRSDWTDWTTFAASLGVDPLPVDSATATLYVESLTSVRGLAPSTIGRRLGTLGRAHRTAGIAAPDLTTARDVLTRIAKADDSPPRRARALNVAEVKALLTACDTTPAGVRDRALIGLGFTIAARRSELVALRWSDIEPADEGILVHVWRAKTSRRDVIAVPYGDDGTCPVAALDAWRAVTGGGGDEPIFLRVDRHGRIGTEASGRPGASDGSLSGATVTSILRRAAVAAGISADMISGHSLRRSMATAARAGGADQIAIARQGGWSETSRVLASYIDDSDRWSANAVSGLL